MTYTVKKGDCLWTIAKTLLGNPLRWREIATKNGISTDNPVIYPGQVLSLDIGSSSSSSTPKPNTSNEAKIEYFGLQAGTDRTVYAVWKWDQKHTKEYKIRWWYATADGIHLLGSESTTEFTHSTYNAPANAERTWFHVMPVSETYKSNDKDVSYWTAKWSTKKTYYFKDNPPTKPAAPSVEVKDFTLTTTLDNLDLNATSIEFQVVQDNSAVFATGTAKITTGHASYLCILNAGSEYKVRCRSLRDELQSGWSEYSDNCKTPPSAPNGITDLRALSETSVYIEWGTVPNADGYTIEYTTKQSYFDSSSEVSSVSVDAKVHHAEITGLGSGEEYFFRVMATNNTGNSAWTEIRTIVIGKKPAAPTTWSSTTTVTVGEPLNLYWVHNAVDGSSQTYAELEIIDSVGKRTETIKNTTNEDEKDKTSVYSIDTSSYREGAKIQWRVRTAGITKQYGDWSVQREINVYAPPTLSLKVVDENKQLISTLERLPFYVNAFAGPNTQMPVGYYLTVISEEFYETVDNVGNAKIVKAGEAVYSRYFDTNDELAVKLSADNIDLENNVKYTVTCVVSMNSGLTVERSSSFRVAWVEQRYVPNAEISIDRGTLAAHIRPYCEERQNECRKVNYDPATGGYTKTDEVLEGIEGHSTADNAVTTTGEPVYVSADSVYFCVVVSDRDTLIDGVTLSVYRREFDGGFTEIGRGLRNVDNTFVTDPHPALDYARYRVVAVTDATGAVAYYDVPGYPVQEKSVVIQWNEGWSTFDNVGGEQQEQPAWSGSMLKLMYNIDVSDDNNPDIAFVEYVGRRYPVSYYGTHLGASATWNVEIPKTDADTLYTIRRLSVYMGNVYVREPSGSGYWANIKVSYSQKHRELTVPITFSITRVEGGV